MNLLAIETSCDETSAAIVAETGDRARPWAVQSNIVASQAAIHRENLSRDEIRSTEKEDDTVRNLIARTGALGRRRTDHAIDAAHFSRLMVSYSGRPTTFE